MVTKKNENKNLEKRQFLRFEIGLAIALALAFVAIEWTSSKQTEGIGPSTGDPFDEASIRIPITRSEIEKKIKRPTLPKINIVEDIASIDDVKIIFEDEIDPEDAVEYYPYYEEEKGVDLPIVWIAEQMPRYRDGGLVNFQKHIQQIVTYPQLAAEIGIQGKVFVKFVVNKEGHIEDIEILKSVNPLLEKEVIAAINKSEKWQPGMQGGIPVKVAMAMPVLFRLQ